MLNLSRISLQNVDTSKLTILSALEEVSIVFYKSDCVIIEYECVDTCHPYSKNVVSHLSRDHGTV